MLDWVRASVAFFGYVLLVAPLVRGLVQRRRRLATIGSLAGLTLAVTGQVLPYTKALHEWIMPPSLLLIGYWTSGLLFARPMPRAEGAFAALDQFLKIDRMAAATPRWLAELFEIGYAGVYPLIPLALAIHLFSPAPDPERFWTVLLVTDFICFGFLPWVQTRPPRAFCAADPWVCRLRRHNLRLLGTTSIQANTFPSGHAAEALAATLLVLGAPWALVVPVGISALLVSAGAVLGRYHYAADALAGWLVAAAVWIVV